MICMHSIKHKKKRPTISTQNKKCSVLFIKWRTKIAGILMYKCNNCVSVETDKEGKTTGRIGLKKFSQTTRTQIRLRRNNINQSETIAKCHPRARRGGPVRLQIRARNGRRPVPKHVLSPLKASKSSTTFLKKAQSGNRLPRSHSRRKGEIGTSPCRNCPRCKPSNNHRQTQLER